VTVSLGSDVASAIRRSLEPIRTLIVDDHALFRRGLEIVLVSEPDIDVVGQAGDGTEAVAKAGEFVPDVVLMDVRMPRSSGIEACRAIKDVVPSAKIIILTMSDEEEDLFEAIRAGASGYLLKDIPLDELAEAVRRVHQGLRVIHPDLATEAWGETDPLTDRERQVLRLAGEGMQSGDIAAELSLSEGTVRNYLSEAISKMGASNRVEASRIARTKGWL